MKLAQFLRAAIVATFLSNCMSAPAQIQTPPTIRVIAVPSIPLPVAIAKMNGVFAKYGVEVQAEVAPSSDALRKALASGEADLAHAAVDNAVAMDETADVVIVMGGEGSLNELIAQPSVHSVTELRGKILIVDAVHTAYALQLKKILLAEGLQTGSDYELKPVGTTPQRLQAMREHKDYAASMLGPHTSVLAKHAGFVSLGPEDHLKAVFDTFGVHSRGQMLAAVFGATTSTVEGSGLSRRLPIAEGASPHSLGLGIPHVPAAACPSPRGSSSR